MKAPMSHCVLMVLCFAAGTQPSAGLAGSVTLDFSESKANDLKKEGLSIDWLGLGPNGPGSNIDISASRPAQTDGVGGVPGTPVYGPYETPCVGPYSENVFFKLSVPKQTIGFLNQSSKTLGFYLFFGAAKSTLSLAPSEIITVAVPAGTVVTGTIPTAQTSVPETLSAGTIYTIQATQNGTWVFAAM